jgi:hypothetical protein
MVRTTIPLTSVILCVMDYVPLMCSSVCRLHGCDTGRLRSSVHSRYCTGYRYIHYLLVQNDERLEANSVAGR